MKIPEGWKEKSLEKICDLQAGKFISASEIIGTNDGTLYPCYGGNGLRGYVNRYSHDGIFPLIGRQGALCGNINKASGKFYATEHAVVATPFSNIEVHWLYYELVFSDLNKYATGAAQPGLSVNNIKKISVPLPPLPEQKAIADILSTWDEAIEKTEKLIKEKERRFKGLLSSLIKEKDGWKKVKLGDVCEVIVSNVDKKTDGSEISVRLCNYMDVYKNLYIKSDLEFMEATATKDEIRKYSLKKYDVLLTKDSETPDDIAISACVVEELNNIVCGYHLAILRPNQSCYGPFLNYLLHTKEMRYFFSSQANGATRFGLSVDSFHKARCSFPPLPEQKSIAETLNTAQEEINILKQLSEKYKKQKQGLMQKLLTGEWRVLNDQPHP